MLNRTGVVVQTRLLRHGVCSVDVLAPWKKSNDVRSCCCTDARLQSSITFLQPRNKVLTSTKPAWLHFVSQRHFLRISVKQKQTCVSGAVSYVPVRHVYETTIQVGLQEFIRSFIRSFPHLFSHLVSQSAIWCRLLEEGWLSWSSISLYPALTWPSLHNCIYLYILLHLLSSLL